MNEQNTAAMQTVVCGQCTHEFGISQETLVERPYEADGVNNVTQVVLVCPACLADTHCYFNGPRLRRFQATLDMALKDFQRRRTPGNLRNWQKAKKRYQTEFDRFQKEVQEVGHAT